MTAIDDVSKDFSSKKEQPYERFYFPRKASSLAVSYTSSRPPNASDVGTGDELVDFMLRQGLPRFAPLNPSIYQNEWYYTLNSNAQAATLKVFHEQEKVFRSLTEKNNGDGRLGNFDADTIIAETFKRYSHSSTDETDGDFFFYGNSFDSKVDFLVAVKRVLDSLPQTPSGDCVKVLLKRALGAAGDFDAFDKPMLGLDGLDLKIYDDVYLADRLASYQSAVGVRHQKLMRLRYPAIAPLTPAQIAALVPVPTPAEQNALAAGSPAGSAEYADGTPAVAAAAGVAAVAAVPGTARTAIRRAYGSVYYILNHLTGLYLSSTETP